MAARGFKRGDRQLAGHRQPTQFGRALQQLGVTFIAAQTPQAKGRIERLWGVLQDRPASELRLAGACDLYSANRVLGRFLADTTAVSLGLRARCG